MRGLVVVLVSCLSSVAFADAIDDAMAQLEIGEIDAARSGVEAVSIRDRATLVRVLEARARIAHATRDDEAITQALRALDALDPNHVFGPSVPPELGERLAAMDTPRISLSVASAELGTGLSLVVRVDDAAGLSSATRLFVRVDGQTLETGERSFAVPLDPGGHAEVWAELRGDGGVVLERWGSAESPNLVERAATNVDVESNLDGHDVDNGENTADPRARRRRIILGAVITALILGVVGGAIGGVYVAKNNRDARLGQPVLR